MDYELISGFVLMGISFILATIYFSTNDKPLRLFFLWCLAISLPLDIAYISQIVKINNTTGSLDALASLLDTGYFMTTFILIFISSYLVILLIPFSMEWINNHFIKKKPVNDSEQLLEALE